MILSVG